MRALVAAVVCLASASFANASGSTDGIGRISVGGGARWTLNDWFNGKAAAAGRPVTTAEGFVTAPLGFQGTASFGYGAFDWFEVAVDVFGGFESFQLEGWQPFSSTSYGALVGLRVTRYDVLFPGFVPYVGVQTGPILSTVTSPSAPGSENVLQGWSVNGGAAYKITDRLGFFVDVRYLLGRVFVAEIAGRNVGGVFVSVGVSIFLPAAPKRDFDVPGFSRQ